MTNGVRGRFVVRPVWAHGWMPRAELGADVWETPGGQLVRQEKGWWPVIVSWVAELPPEPQEPSDDR